MTADPSSHENDVSELVNYFTHNLSNMSDRASKELDDQKELVSLGTLFAEYLRPECNEQMHTFDDSIEDLLTRLDEYHGLLDMIRSDTSLCLHKTLPIIHDKGQEIQKMFNRIDELEAFVVTVKQNLSVLENEVERAESEMGSLSTIKKVFNSISLPSFLTPKKQTSPSKQAPPNRPRTPYSPPAIFSVANYFGPHSQDDSDHTLSLNKESVSELDHHGVRSNTVDDLTSKISDLQSGDDLQTGDDLQPGDDFQTGGAAKDASRETGHTRKDVAHLENCDSNVSENIDDKTADQLNPDCNEANEKSPRMSRDADSGLPGSVISEGESP